MAEKTYKCYSCLKDFKVKYIFFKPGNVSCPYCGSSKVQQEKNSGCGCEARKGFRFT